MLVNHELKMAFVHAPKCAGLALSQWLAEHYGFEEFAEPNSFCPDSEIELIERHRYVIPIELLSYEVITCVREPIERWESFCLYYSLQLGVNETFEEFTRDKLNFLPLQKRYTEKATYILGVESLDSEVLKLPFMKRPVPEITRYNVSRDMRDYHEIKQRIVWTDELRNQVVDHFRDDYKKIRTLTRSAS